MSHPFDPHYAPRNGDVADLLAAQPFARLVSAGGNDVAFKLPLRAAWIRHYAGAPA
ncbi:MAG: hypothetical protein J0I77_04360 [Rudaea sp.]|uniref:hypothetical protein n=1 Tax=unclassified Rudaea TaxID=2627037 RepID=UPI00148518E6|nr:MULTISPECIES: hypothetical protein [unclassified Rudaea]MBN8884926.1 hypothetical protein [Rudaea sp.]MBR0346317.1 hypothetical protein [Rudaea sp.]